MRLEMPPAVERALGLLLETVTEPLSDQAYAPAGEPDGVVGEVPAADA